MGLLNPWFLLAGALLVAVPIAIHLLNRRRFTTVSWAAMDFLLKAMKRNRRRLKFESWLLLAARCAVLLLLGLALARPMGCGGGALATLAGRPAGLHVLVIDNSGSMSYQREDEAATHLARAKQIAGGLLTNLSAGGERAMVLTASTPAAAVFDAATYDLDAAASAIDALPETAAGTDLAGALEQAADYAEAAATDPNRVLHVLTDATMPAFADAERLAAVGPRLAAVYDDIMVHDVSAAGQWNRAVIGLEPRGGLVRRGFDNVMVGTIRGYGQPAGGAIDVEARFEVDGRPADGAIKTVRPDAQTPPVLATPEFPGGGRHTVGLALGAADSLPFDDARQAVIDVAANLPVLIVDGRRGMGPLTGSGEFLEIALAPPTSDDTPGEVTRSYVRAERISDLELGNKVLGDYAAVFLAGVGNLNASAGEALAKYVEAGGALVLMMGDAVTSDNYNAVLGERGLLPGPLVQTVRAATAGEGARFDFDATGNLHPYLAAFRDVPNSGLENAVADQYWRIAPNPERNAEVILQFTAGEDEAADPAILLHRLGGGRVLTVATAADPEMQWSDLSSKPVFVSLIHELLSNLTGGGDAWLNLTVGEPLVVPATSATAGSAMLFDPQNRSTPLIRDATGRLTSDPLTTPGLWRLQSGGASYDLAVNPPAGESDVRRLDRAAVESALGDIDLIWLDAAAADTTATLAADRNDFGWAILLAVLALAGAECFMATHFGRSRA
jgi:hypothetical protein